MQVQPGSIIKRPLKCWFSSFSWIVGIRWHMGVYIGDNEVIHFNGEKTTRHAVIAKHSLEAFACGEKLQVHAVPKNVRHAEAVCAHAEQLLGAQNNAYNHKYSFVFNNCEDFSLACFRVRYA